MDIKIIKLFRKKIRQLEIELGNHMKKGKGCFGITFSQCHTLLEIGERGKISLVDLASILGLDNSTLSRTIDGMVHVGLVNRITNPNDRRFISITLTAQGKSLYDLIENHYNNLYAKIFMYIPENKQPQVVESFSLIYEAIKKHRENFGDDEQIQCD